MVIPAIPLLWLFSQNFYYLVGVQVLAGLAAAGFDLCTPNFIYATAPAGSRIRYVAYFRSLNSVAMALGALLGGYLALVLPPILGYSTLALFLLSAAARAVVAWRMLPPVVDIAHKRGTTSEIIYRRKGMLTTDAASYGVGWGLLYVPTFRLGNFGKDPAPSSKDSNVVRGRGGEGMTSRAILALHSRFKGEIKPREVTQEVPYTAGKAALHNPDKQKALKAGKFAPTENGPAANAAPSMDHKSAVKGLEKRSQAKQLEAREDPPVGGAKRGGVLGSDWMRKAFKQRTEAGQGGQDANAVSAQPFQTPVMHRPELMSKIADRLSPETRSEPQAQGMNKARQQSILKQMTRQAEEKSQEAGGAQTSPGGILHDRLAWKAYEGEPTAGQESRNTSDGMLRPELRMQAQMGKAARADSSQLNGANNMDSSQKGSGIRRQGLLGNSEAWQKYQAQGPETPKRPGTGTSPGGRAGMLGPPETNRGIQDQPGGKR
jgi:hypothetical protein